jgi:hypothetical protein
MFVPQDTKHEPSQGDGVARKSSHDIPSKYRAIMKGEASREELNASRTRWAYDEISIERESGITESPVYKATMHKDGSAELHVGKNCDMAPGDYVAAIDPQRFGRLCYALDRAEFLTLDDRYAVDSTCWDTCTVSIRSGKTRKSTSDYGCAAPIEFWMVEAVIDVVQEHLNWFLPK